MEKERLGPKELMLLSLLMLAEVVLTACATEDGRFDIQKVDAERGRPVTTRVAEKTHAEGVLEEVTPKEMMERVEVKVVRMGRELKTVGDVLPVSIGDEAEGTRFLLFKKTEGEGLFPDRIVVCVQKKGAPPPVFLNPAPELAGVFYPIDPDNLPEEIEDTPDALRTVQEAIKKDQKVWYSNCGNARRGEIPETGVLLNSKLDYASAPQI